MTRYIDADKLLEYLEKAAESEDVKYSVIGAGVQAAISVIKTFPMENVAPVVHAHWKRIGDVAPTGLHGLHYCSLCGYPSMRSFNVSSREVLTPYCPDCGAKMDEEEGQR